MPPALATRLAYSPALPKGKAKLLAALIPGTLTKATAVYDRPFWREAGLSGQGVSDVGPARTTFDNSLLDGSVGALFGFVGGSAYAPWGPLPADQRLGAGARELRRLRRLRAARARRLLLEDRTKERWTRGCRSPTSRRAR